MRKFRHLYDSRFISIIKILTKVDESKILAGYLIRLIFGLKSSSAFRYIREIDRFLVKSKNKLQYFEPKYDKIRN